MRKETEMDRYGSRRIFLFFFLCVSLRLHSEEAARGSLTEETWPTLLPTLGLPMSIDYPHTRNGFRKKEEKSRCLVLFPQWSPKQSQSFALGRKWRRCIDRAPLLLLRWLSSASPGGRNGSPLPHPTPVLLFSLHTRVLHTPIFQITINSPPLYHSKGSTKKKHRTSCGRY